MARVGSRVDAGTAQFDDRERIVLHRDEKMRAARRDFDEPEQSARLSVHDPDRTRMAIGIELAEAKCDARGSGMQLFEQVCRDIGPAARKREIGERGRPHRRRARGAAKFGHHHQNFAQPAFAEVTPERGDALPHEPGPDRRNFLRQGRRFHRRVRVPVLAEKTAQGIPEHLPDFVARELTQIHGRSYA